MIDFCAFSFESNRLDAVMIDEMWLWVFPLQLSLGSGLSLCKKVDANSDKALLTVPATNGSVYQAQLCSPLRIEIVKAATILGL